MLKCVSEKRVMKKNIWVDLVVLAGLTGDVRAGKYGGGSGEPNDPHLIVTAADW